MQVITARSVSEALSAGLHTIRVHGVRQESRVGDVLVSPRPVMTVYQDPTNRVLLSPMRDANPFFHVMEALWMLAGRNDLPWLVRFNKRFAAYSDDGGLTQPGAYGYRWRNYFGHDQLVDIILELKRNPQTRRCVLAMWDGGARADWQGSGEEPEDAQPGDFFAAVAGSADVPCNTHCYFDTIDGRLNMTVCCRSNDIIWGAYGANAVHFSFLLEYLSAMTGIPMGVYRQFSNNFHLYTNVVAEENIMPMARDVEATDLYTEPEHHSAVRRKLVSGVYKVSLVAEPEQFESDLYDFMHFASASAPYHNPFFPDVAVPMYESHALYREKDYDKAIERARDIKADDWRQACIEWLQRRKIKADVNAKPFTEVVEKEPSPTMEDFVGAGGAEHIERTDDGTN